MPASVFRPRKGTPKVRLLAKDSVAPSRKGADRLGPGDPLHHRVRARRALGAHRGPRGRLLQHVCAVPHGEEARLRVKNSLNERRQERGRSQQRLADELGVSRQTVISIERGRFDPSLPLAFRLARVFGCRIDELFDPREEGA
jgi:putative transcriptional regulator